MNLKQASVKVRNTLAPYTNYKVKGKTISFEGFGFGSSGFIDIICSEPLPDQALKLLVELKPKLQSQENKLILTLSGPAYPFGGKV